MAKTAYIFDNLEPWFGSTEARMLGRKSWDSPRVIPGSPGNWRRGEVVMLVPADATEPWFRRPYRHEMHLIQK